MLSLGWWGKEKNVGQSLRPGSPRGSWITAKNRSLIGDAAGGKEGKEILWVFFSFCHSLPLAGPDWKPATKGAGKRAFGCQLLRVRRGEDWYKHRVNSLHLEARFYGKYLSLSNRITAYVKTAQYRKYPGATVGFVHLKSTPQREIEGRCLPWTCISHSHPSSSTFHLPPFPSPPHLRLG